jgi:hypothetical protein
MKKISLLLLSFITSAPVIAQLENTRWKSTVTIGEPVNVIFDFKKDTVALYRVADGTLIENMSYIYNNASFTLRKIAGQSDCDNTTPGKYSFKITHDKMFIKLVKDDCYDRSSVINDTEWSVWKEPVAIKVSEAILKQYVGRYETDAAHPIAITLENGILYAEGPDNKLPKSPLTPESNTKFFLRIAGVEWHFIKDAKGHVVSLISHEAKDYELKKVR